MDQLDFEYHRREYQALVGSEKLEADAYFLAQAQYVHSLVVHDALRDAQVSAVTIAPMLVNEQARYFINYGVGRRLRMIWVSYRGLLALVQTDRKEPLSLDDVGAISRDLNVIYINIRGVLDNLAWCLLHEVASDQIRNLDPVKVGLFSPALMNDSNLISLKVRLEEFSTWHRELKCRRDPAAHRIPLSVPPAILNPEEASRYRELDTEISAAMNEMDFDRADKLGDQQAKIGKFISCFLHHPDEKITPIYPTVPQDIANLTRIMEHVRNFLQAARR